MEVQVIEKIQGRIDRTTGLKINERIKVAAYARVSTDSEDQLRLLKLMGYSEETIQEKFSPLLKGLSCATPPHGGFAIGLDRIAMLLCRDNRINSVTAFPKTPDCRDLLTNGPKKEIKIEEGR